LESLSAIEKGVYCFFIFRLTDTKDTATKMNSAKLIQGVSSASLFIGIHSPQTGETHTYTPVHVVVPLRLTVLVRLVSPSSSQ